MEPKQQISILGGDRPDGEKILDPNNLEKLREELRALETAQPDAVLNRWFVATRGDGAVMIFLPPDGALPPGRAVELAAFLVAMAVVGAAGAADSEGAGMGLVEQLTQHFCDTLFQASGGLVQIGLDPEHKQLEPSNWLGLAPSE